MELTLYSHIDHTLDQPDDYEWLIPDSYTCYNRFNPNNGREWFEAPLGYAPINGTSQDIELVFTSKGYYARVGDKGYAIRREIEGLENNTATAMEYYGFVGGAYKASGRTNWVNKRLRNVITVKGQMDPAATWWIHTNYKSYDRSRFYNGEFQIIYAKNEINACLPKIDELDAITNGSAGSKESFFQINSGATINLVTSEIGRIRFSPGFHAKPGSNVRAYIGAAINTQETVPRRCVDGASSRKDKVDVNNTEGLEFNSVSAQEINTAGSQPQKVTLLPNPTSGIFRIEGLENKKITLLTIFNTTGTKVIELKDFITKELFELNLQGQLSGIYLINVLEDNNIHTLRILKQ